jgi:hypothetical protein
MHHGPRETTQIELVALTVSGKAQTITVSLDMDFAGFTV